MVTNAVVELTPWLETLELRDLMRPLIGWRGEPERDQEAIEQAIDRYSRPTNLAGFVVVRESRLVGMIGIETTDQRHGIIHHVVVASLLRRCGIGRLLIDSATSRLELASLEAETDVDAVQFYAKCGFTVRSLGEKHPGRERFLCVSEAQ
jgi:ribosomal protein S18 acetylase RimI-like enzyme